MEVANMIIGFEKDFGSVPSFIAPYLPEFTCPFVSLNGPMFVKVGQEFKYSVVVDKVVVPTDWEKIAGETADVKLLSNVNGVATFVALKPSVRLTDCVQIYGKNPTPKSTDKIGKRLYIAPDSMDPVGSLAWIYDEANDQFKWNASDPRQAPPWWSIPYSSRTVKAPYPIAEPFRYLVFGFDHPDSNVFAPAFAVRCDDEILKLALQSDPDGKNFVGSMVRNKYIPAITRWLANYDIEHLTITYSQNGVQKSGTIHRPEVLLTFLQIVCSDKKYDGDIDAAFDRYQKSKLAWAAIGPQWQIDKDVTALDAAGAAVRVVGSEIDPFFWLKAISTNNYTIQLPEKGESSITGVAVEGGLILFGPYLAEGVAGFFFKRIKPTATYLFPAYEMAQRPLRGLVIKAEEKVKWETFMKIEGYEVQYVEKLEVTYGKDQVRVMSGATLGNERGGIVKINTQKADLWTYIDEFTHVYNNKRGRGINYSEPTASLHKEYAQLYRSEKGVDQLVNDEYHKMELANMILGMDRLNIGSYPPFITPYIAELKDFCSAYLKFGIKDTK